MKRACPLQCRRRYDGDRAASTQIEWAGLRVNLDLAFSREKRDKVYVQHVKRKQGSQLSRWLRAPAQLCVCEVAADDGILEPDTAKD
ncbi:hypothetical protein [Mycobacterium sp. 852002-51057_SCH5723018]|uniref:hypothetical protein n=1 Tax=Mycobacterium sp. 852002-51057_SCH5723018 TaxID=1834094 RepID=UPI0007FFA6C4|nr:hypothetical protein [Mycobacterium sp. 852002-51057_SCH5723018]OBG22731.1 hypothetical protein A5764_12270 [Mycobacterium sp. 852002-51057_SCH5723018]